MPYGFRHGTAVRVHTLPAGPEMHEFSRLEAIFQSAKAGPRPGVSRTRRRQLARALVLASHSKRDGSPRAEMGASAHVTASAAPGCGPIRQAAASAALSAERAALGIQAPAARLETEVSRAVHIWAVSWVMRTNLGVHDAARASPCDPNHRQLRLSVQNRISQLRVPYHWSKPSVLPKP